MNRDVVGTGGMDRATHRVVPWLASTPYEAITTTLAKSPLGWPPFAAARRARKGIAYGPRCTGTFGKRTFAEEMPDAETDKLEYGGG
jgi:hypothetical protein